MPFSTSTCPGLTTTYWRPVGRGTCELAPTLLPPSDSGDAPWVSPASTLQGKWCPQLPPSHLIAEGQGHDGDEKAKKSLQFAEP